MIVTWTGLVALEIRRYKQLEGCVIEVVLPGFEKWEVVRKAYIVLWSEQVGANGSLSEETSYIDWLWCLHPCSAFRTLTKLF